MQLQTPIPLEMQGFRPIPTEHNEIHILRIRHSLEFDRQLIQIPHLHHRLIRPRPDRVFTIIRDLYLYRRLRESEILDEFKLAEGVLSTLSFGGGGFFVASFGGKPGGKGGGRGGGGTVDGVDFGVGGGAAIRHCGYYIEPYWRCFGTRFMFLLANREWQRRR